EIVSLRYFEHARGQREAVGRVLEQRIIRDFHLMIVDTRNARVEPDGIGIGDEMHFVAAVGQLQAKLGGHDPTAAVGGVACNTDPHRFGIKVAIPIWPCRFSSGEAASPPPNQTRMVSPSISADGSQMTFPFQGSEPAKEPGAFSQVTPSLDRARPIRLYSLRSRPV